MKPTEAAALLTIAAAFDNRKPDADQAKAWALALNDARFEDCRDAIVEHYSKSREWLMPSDVWAGVRRLRNRRFAEYGPITPPADLDPDDRAAHRRWLRQTAQAIGDGTMPPPAALTGIKRDVVAELGHVGHTIEESDR